MNREQVVEIKLARETKVFEENPLQCLFVQYKSHMTTVCFET
jgi:hypothetical protein